MFVRQFEGRKTPDPFMLENFPQPQFVIFLLTTFFSDVTLVFFLFLFFFVLFCLFVCLFFSRVCSPLHTRISQLVALFSKKERRVLRFQKLERFLPCIKTQSI